VSFIPTAQELFFSKHDPEDPRLGDCFKPGTLNSDLHAGDIALLGYPDDEGIQMNGGRPGAIEAPQLIRQFLYKMTWPTANLGPRRFFDLGDLNIKNDLDTKHHDALVMMTELQKRNLQTVSFGGGHDYGHSDTAAFIKNNLNAKQRPLVINFDAHLDVRPTDQGHHSGTPFRRLLMEYGPQIDFVEIGLQPQCNSVFHREWAQKKMAFLYDLKDVEGSKLMHLFEKPPFARLTPQTPVFVSFDIDCLSTSEAGGCSQSWATGLKLDHCLSFLSQLYRISNTRGLGIYEVSPPLDQDFRTSKTAAILAYHFIFKI
jgi:formiminoglutamase